MTTMLKATMMKKYQKFWIKRSLLRKKGALELPVHEDYSTLRLLCESLLSERDAAALNEIVMDDLMERTVDTDAEATCVRLAAILKDRTSGFLPNSYLGDGSTPLHVVAKARFSDSVRVLIQHDADVNAVHLQLGHSVLHVAAMVGCFQTMSHLLNAGANRLYVNTLPGRHRSALHYAAERGSAPCLLMLLNPTQGSLVRRNEEARAVRAVLDLPDAFGNTALHLACVDGSEECVKILIEAGASVAVRNVEGKTAVDVARTMAAGGASPSASAVLFVVMTAAGLDPLAEPLPAAEDDAPSSPAAAAETNICLLDDNDVTNSSSNKTIIYSSGEPAIWVIVKDGLLIATEVDAQSTGHPSALHSRKPPDVSKLSKRLRFVRRSIIGGGGAAEDEAPAGEGPAEQQRGAPARRLSVEVFCSREEAEERVRAVHYPSALACVQSSSSSGSGAVSPLRGATAPPGAGSGVSPAPWGSAQRRDSGTSNTPTRSEPSAVKESPCPATADPALPPTMAFQTAHIDERHLMEFRAKVAHHFPHATHAQQTTGGAYSSVRSLVPVAVAGGVRPPSTPVGAAAAEHEDPMWAEFKRTQSASKLTGSNAHNPNSAADSGRYGDTSLSNKPVKLQRAGSSATVNIGSAEAATSPVGTPTHPKSAAGGNRGETTKTPPVSPATAATAAPALQSAKALQARKVALAAQCMTLGTDITALHAQIFERMCQLEELQDLQRRRASGDSAARQEGQQQPSVDSVSLLVLEEGEDSEEAPQVSAMSAASVVDCEDVYNDGAGGDGAGDSPVTPLQTNAHESAPGIEPERVSVVGEQANQQAEVEEKYVRELAAAQAEAEAAAALERSNQLMLDGVTLSMQAELEGEGAEGFDVEDREYGSEGGRDSALLWEA